MPTLDADAYERQYRLGLIRELAPALAQHQFHDIQNIQNDLVFLLSEIDRLEGELREAKEEIRKAKAEGWNACTKEIIYKGLYFKECKGWLHVDTTKIISPYSAPSTPPDPAV